jgi:GNAT superfamily N-acetyltransferase
VSITVQPRREEALKAGFRALGARLPAGIDYGKFRTAMEPWDVKAFCDGERPVGMLMVKGNELHVAVIPEVRGKWLSRRLIREVIAPIIRKHGEAKTSVTPDNGVGRDFIKRLGFTGNDVAVLREGFDNLVFDPVTALIGGAAVIGSSLIGSDAASTAADQQASAAGRASDTQLQMFNTVNAQSTPWRQAGENALGTISSMQPQFTHSFNADDLKSNLAPNYDFQLQQGLGAVRNAGNMQTGLISGNTLKGINDYAQNYAGNAYQQAFNNYNAQQTNIFNRLSSIAGLGQTSNQTTAQAGTTAAGNIGNAQMAAGAAQAAGTVGTANALSGGLSNAASWYAIPKFLNLGGSTAGAASTLDMMG